MGEWHTKRLKNSIERLGFFDVTIREERQAFFYSAKHNLLSYCGGLLGSGYDQAKTSVRVLEIVLGREKRKNSLTNRHKPATLNEL